MKIGVCFFIETNLGGAATQADDLVTAARRLGHTACLLRFTSSKRARGLWDYNKKGIPHHQLNSGRTGLKMESEKLLVSPETIEKAVRFLNTFDELIFVGGCPHITRNFSRRDFEGHYKPIYTETKCYKTMFFTDPFWQKLYPYAADIIDKIDIVYAFAEAYKRIVEDSGLSNEVSICNFGAIDAMDRAKKMNGLSNRESTDTIVWPHQWRSWKNPELIIQMAPYLSKHINGYSDGIEYHKIRRDRWEQYEAAVDVDHIKNEKINEDGNMTMLGIVSRNQIITEFASSRWMIDLTGMSARTGEPLKKFVGNYQCVNIECMMLGCANFKYENTVEPYSQIPKDCVISLPLVTEPKELASIINGRLGIPRYDSVARRAREWSMANFDPEKVFDECFVKPFV